MRKANSASLCKRKMPSPAGDAIVPPLNAGDLLAPGYRVLKHLRRG